LVSPRFEPSIHKEGSIAEHAVRSTATAGS